MKIMYQCLILTPRIYIPINQSKHHCLKKEYFVMNVDTCGDKINSPLTSKSLIFTYAGHQ